jgi:hypothetical protein
VELKDKATISRNVQQPSKVVDLREGQAHGWPTLTCTIPVSTLPGPSFRKAAINKGSRLSVLKQVKVRLIKTSRIWGQGS